MLSTQPPWRSATILLDHVANEFDLEQSDVWQVGAANFLAINAALLVRLAEQFKMASD